LQSSTGGVKTQVEKEWQMLSLGNGNVNGNVFEKELMLPMRRNVLRSSLAAALLHLDGQCSLKEQRVHN
jgi:hypothetical protein